MAFKTAEQMIEIIVNEKLLADACMTIIEGRNEYGFHAAKVPAGSIKKLTDTAYELLLTDGENDIHVPVNIPESDTDLSTSIWLVRYKDDGNYDIITIQHDATLTDTIALEQKEYLSIIMMFLEHYKITTRTKLISLLKNGYKRLKEETGEDNAYELLRDCMDTSYVVQRTDKIPTKFNIRFNFLE